MKKDKYARLFWRLQREWNWIRLCSAFTSSEGQHASFQLFALVSWQRLSLSVRRHSPLLNVLSACLRLSVLYPEVCHFFLWPRDLIPLMLGGCFPFFFLCPQSIPSTPQFFSSNHLPRISYVILKENSYAFFLFFFLSLIVLYKFLFM